MVPFQCSRHATAAGIIHTFKLCADFQRKIKDDFVSVVVLDEVGLAEDSENMPLKVRILPKNHIIYSDKIDGNDVSNYRIILEKNNNNNDTII